MLYCIRLHCCPTHWPRVAHHTMRFPVVFLVHSFRVRRFLPLISTSYPRTRQSVLWHLWFVVFSLKHPWLLFPIISLRVYPAICLRCKFINLGLSRRWVVITRIEALHVDAVPKVLLRPILNIKLAIHRRLSTHHCLTKWIDLFSWVKFCMSHSFHHHRHKVGT